MASIPNNETLSFEGWASGDAAPPDPWRVLNDPGTVELSTNVASDGSNSIHLASYRNDLAETRVGVEVALDDVATIVADAYVEASNLYWGYLTVHLDENNKLIRLDNKDSDTWYRNRTADVSDVSGKHTLILRAVGDGNDAYFDNIRFLDSSDTRIDVAEVTTAEDGRKDGNGETPRVEDNDGNGVGGATIQLFGIGVYTDSKSEGRKIAETTTDQTGVFELPTTFSDADEQLVLTARKGDWFTSSVFDPKVLDTVEDYDIITLDRQLLAGPTVVRDPNDEPFGTVTVWRYLVEEDVDIFYTEVTNNSIVDDKSWLILQTGAVDGPLGGDFLFSYPDGDVAVDESTTFSDKDPTGDGGVQVFATHPPQTEFCCNEPFSLPKPLKPSPAGFFHPVRSHTVIPLYETTKNLGSFATLEDQPSVGAGWHTITPESTDNAAEVERRLEKGLEFPTNACDLFGISCGIGFLLDALDRLTWLNRLLDGGRRVATVNKTPNMPIVGGAAPAAEFDVWRSDKPSPFDKSHEASVVYQVPVRVQTDDPVTYSVQTEWVRPYNNRGKFSGTFTTAAIDIAIERPVEPLTPGEPYWADIRLQNRSLESKTITGVTVETPTGTQELTVDTELAPGNVEYVPMDGDEFFIPDEGASETQLQITAVAADNTTFTQTNRFRHVGSEPSDGDDSISASQEKDGSSRRNSGSTDSSGETGNRSSDDDADTDSGSNESGSDGSGPGFGVGNALAGLSGTGYLLKRRLSAEDSADENS